MWRFGGRVLLLEERGHVVVADGNHVVQGFLRRLHRLPRLVVLQSEFHQSVPDRFVPLENVVLYRLLGGDLLYLGIDIKHYLSPRINTIHPKMAG